MSELDRFFDAYAEQSLDDQQRAAFCAWLYEDDAHVAEFSREAFLHWQLLAIGRRRNLQSDVADAPSKGERIGLRRAASEEAAAREQARGRRPAGRRTLVAAAALLLAAAAVVWAVKPWERTAMVAQVTKAAPGVAWSGRATLTAGSFLPTGQVLAIDRGRVLTTLASGVQIVLEGPAELRLLSPSKIFLAKGRMTVEIPRQAMGFVVESNLGEFIDLGTEYTLKLKASGGCELHVFSGLVEFRPAMGTLEGPLTIPEGRALSYDPASGKTSILPYRTAEKMSL
jgi:ferric-dicitrate binding protein FerR (iron transport regulator)